MKITSRVGIVSFAILTAIISVLFVVVLVQLLFPPALHEFTIWRAVAITVLTTIPICLFVGAKIYENTALGIELQRLVDRDRLTDVATRDFFFDAMDRDPDAYGVSLMIDIDHFKAVNDVHGHLVGDDVIKTVSDVLRRECRARDIVCRFGGEEFVVFLHEASGEQGRDVAERIRHAVETEPTRSETQNLRVTVSIGGSLKDAADDITASIKRADEALYKAKKTGRNRIVMDFHLDDLPQPLRAIR